MPTLTLLTQMPQAVLCGMRWVGKLAHLQGFPIQLPTISMSVVRKASLLLLQLQLSQGKLKNGILLSCSCWEANISLAQQWHAMAAFAVPFLVLAYLKDIFSQQLPKLSHSASTHAQAAAHGAQCRPAICPRSIWLRNHCSVLFEFVDVHWKRIPYSQASTAKCSDSGLQMVVWHP